MLSITVTLSEQWNEITQEFTPLKVVTLEMEHSLVSLSDWESKHCKPFLSKDEKTIEETLDYIKFMTLTPNVDPEVYNHLSKENIEAINEYISRPMTATKITRENKGRVNREIITSEIIYHWMIALTIPVEFQYWHLNKLLALIEVCNIKNQPPKKMGKRDILSRNAALNAARRQQMNTKG